jgi:N-methylhydantoinase B
MSSPFNASNIPVEALELSKPVVVERFELSPDTGGAGQFRGGCGIRRDLRMVGEDIKFNNLTDRHRFQPYGLAGGQPGSSGRTVVNPGTPGERTVPSKASIDLEAGDVISFQLAGGGGYGDPFQRDPEAVVRDVRLGLVSSQAAERDYGVVLGEGLSVDIDATNRLRASASSGADPR